MVLNRQRKNVGQLFTERVWANPCTLKPSTPRNATTSNLFSHPTFNIVCQHHLLGIFLIAACISASWFPYRIAHSAALCLFSLLLINNSLASKASTLSIYCANSKCTNGYASASSSRLIHEYPGPWSYLYHISAPAFLQTTLKSQPPKTSRSSDKLSNNLL
jgi:hypothetical protein